MANVMGFDDQCHGEGDVVHEADRSTTRDSEDNESSVISP
jgi:hypothetical protein